MTNGEIVVVTIVFVALGVGVSPIVYIYTEEFWLRIVYWRFLRKCCQEDPVPVFVDNGYMIIFNDDTHVKKKIIAKLERACIIQLMILETGYGYVDTKYYISHSDELNVNITDGDK